LIEELPAPAPDPIDVLRERVEAGSRPLPVDYPKWPAGALMLDQAARARIVEREAAALREREEAAGLPKAREQWAKRRDEIHRERERAIAEARGVCAESEAAARSSADFELEGLGDYPALESIEVKL